MSSLNPCPLCQGTLIIADFNKGYRVECKAGCLKNHITEASKTVEAAMDDLTKFNMELDFGADMWDSKIRDKVVED